MAGCVRDSGPMWRHQAASQSKALEGGAIGALLELPPFRLDVVEPMMDRNVDCRSRRRRGVARALAPPERDPRGAGR